MVVSGRLLIVSICDINISSLSPGNPRMKCPPTWIFRWAVASIAQRAWAKLWPRLMRSSVESKVDSTPYSIATYLSRAREAK